MTGQPADIICFAKDWNEPKTSNNHVMEELAKRHRVLWVNSVATRTPSLTSGNDLKKIVRKVREWFRGATIIHERLRVFTPVSLPLPHSRLAQALNRWLVCFSVRRVAGRWGFHAPQFWTFLPNVGDLVGRLGESQVIYYCTDEWTGFTHLNPGYVRQKELELLQKADIVFVTSQKLYDSKRPHNAGIHLMPHGVNRALFAQALAAAVPAAPEPAVLPQPVLGFYGNLYDWVDQELLAAIARARPTWSLVLIGKLMTDVATLRACPNIHLLGARPYAQLPAYCKSFAVGLIPYKTTDPRMLTVNPLKLREYLAAGLPVVSVEMPEVRHLVAAGQITPTDVSIATGPVEFIQRIEAMLAADSPLARQRRSDLMELESWTARVAQMENILVKI